MACAPFFHNHQKLLSMKRKLLTLLALALSANVFSAIDPNTVEVKFDGNTATVTMAENIKAYVAVASGTSSHVKLLQAESFAGVDATADNEDGEIIYDSPVHLVMASSILREPSSAVWSSTG